MVLSLVILIFLPHVRGRRGGQTNKPTEPMTLRWLRESQQLVSMVLMTGIEGYE